MGQVYQSGAFIQQCFAVHPLCLALKRIEDSGRMIIVCTSCRMVHHVLVDEVTARVAAVPADAPELNRVVPTTARDVLSACALNHPVAVTIREMDVIRDSVGLRCAECRRVFNLQVAGFESHQKS
ncbi:MAG TPA: hypothetical protein VFQ34_06115 [Nitrospiraceae bacterium]|jgi:hypothetical protein|nr:hypothetical protein [Nitrospiraceae bacterium]